MVDGVSITCVSGLGGLGYIPSDPITDNPLEGELDFPISSKNGTGSVVVVVVLVLGIIEWRCATILCAGCVCATVCG